MPILSVALLGIIVVVASILWLKMHPVIGLVLGLLMMAFAITAIVRAAQGSATVAMTTTVGIIQPLLETIDIPFHPLYVALAIGCGTKPFSHEWVGRLFCGCR